MFAKAKQRLDESVSRATAVTRATAATEARPMPSIIGPDMKVTGNLATPGEVHVDGEIEGDVACAKLTVGANGMIKGGITAASVRVHGRVSGSITADEVYLLSGASVTGDIIQVVLEIAPGAEFEGAVRRSRKPAPRLVETAPMEAAPAAVETTEAPLELTQEAGSPLAAAEAPAEGAKAEETADVTTDDPAPADAGAAAAGGGDERGRGYENRHPQFRRRDQHHRVPNGAA